MVQFSFLPLTGVSQYAGHSGSTLAIWLCLNSSCKNIVSLKTHNSSISILVKAGEEDPRNDVTKRIVLIASQQNWQTLSKSSFSELWKLKVCNYPGIIYSRKLAKTREEQKLCGIFTCHSPRPPQVHSGLGNQQPCNHSKNTGAWQPEEGPCWACSSPKTSIPRGGFTCLAPLPFLILVICAFSF